MSNKKIDFTRPTASPRARGFRLTALAALLAYVSLLVYFSLVPTVPGTAGVSDKLLHFTAYGGLTALTAAAYPRMGLLKLFLAVSAIGIILEIGQGILSIGRMASFADQIANMTGALIALIIWGVMAWLKAKIWRT